MGGCDKWEGVIVGGCDKWEGVITVRVIASYNA